MKRHGDNKHPEHKSKLVTFFKRQTRQTRQTRYLILRLFFNNSIWLCEWNFCGTEECEPSF